MNAPHPEQQALNDYVSGKLDEQSAAMVGTHVAECPECEVTLQAIEANSDTIIAGLREPEKSPTEIFAREAEYQRAIEQAGNLPEVTAIYGAEQTQPSAAPPTPADAGMMQKLGPYELVAKLGEGGMGAVYKAQHEHLGKTVAIKILPTTAMRDPAMVGRFRREMKAVGALHHPNIVGAHDAGEANGVHFLVMEYVAGKDLSTILKDSGPLSVEQAISCTLQAARGLEFAHRKGIIHRDIKPANLLLDEEGTLKILDMGLARLDDNAHNIAAQEGLTQTGQVMGTVDYMAPEQAFDTHRADAKADVYSLGCTLYRILTGQNAYAGETIVQKILAHREKPIPSLRTLRPEVPKALDAIYQRMMAKEPEQRIGMSEVVQELAALQSTPATPATKSFKLPQAPAAIAVHPAVQSGDGKKKIPAVWLAAGFGTAAAAILLTVVFIIRDKDGNEIARVNGPDGSSVTVQPEAKPQNVPATSVESSNIPKQSTPAQETKQVANPIAALDKTNNDPAFEEWVTATAALPYTQQLEAFSKKMIELNPGFDGKLIGGGLYESTPRIEKNTVVSIGFSSELVTDIRPVRVFTKLNKLHLSGIKVKPEDVAALQAKLPNCQIIWDSPEMNSTEPATAQKFAFEQPDFAAWAAEVGRRDPETQLAMVIKKLQELNPDYDGKETHRIQNNEVIEVAFSALYISDLSPVRALRELKTLKCTGVSGTKSNLTSLAPLAGIPLTKLDCYHTEIADLAPLRGMPLTNLSCFATKISDLSPLSGMPLTLLWCYGTEVADLAPLRGAPLKMLFVSNTKVADLGPLAGMPLESLQAQFTLISDLSPLREMPLTQLDIGKTKVTSLAPLETCVKLKQLNVRENSFQAAEIEKLQKALPNCKVE